ncbi:hypothetical protein [Pseudomonas gregormendelii]
MSQEALLWDMAVEHFGSEVLLQMVVEMWGSAAHPFRPVVEHLSTDRMSQEALNILKIAQERVGAFVPDRRPIHDTVTLYARHASDLADGLITRLPKGRLSPAMRGSRIEIELGM